MTKNFCQAQFDDGVRRPTERKKKDYTPPTTPEWKLRNKFLNDRLNAGKAVLKDARKAQLQDQAIRRVEVLGEFYDRLGGLAEVDLDKVTTFSSLLARKLGIKNKIFGLSPELRYTDAAEVRQFILDASRLGEGFVQEVGNILGAAKLKDIRQDVQTTVKAALRGERFNEFFRELVEVGQIPLKVEAYQGRTAAQRLLSRQYDDFTQRYVEAGIPYQTLQELTKKAVAFSDVMDDVRGTAAAFGIDVQDLDGGIGYFPRVVTADFVRESFRANKAQELLKEWSAENFDQRTYDAAVKRVRNTFHYVVEGTDALLPETEALLAKRLKLKDISELYDLMSDETRWLSHLHNKLSPTQLDTLVDEGLISRVGMTSREVFDYFVDQYDLPYKQLKQMFRTDPQDVLKFYTDELAREAGKSAIIQGVVGRGLEEGWGVARRAADVTGVHKGWVTLDGDFLRKRGIQIPTGYSDFLVHPRVAEQWKDLVDLSTDPRKVGMVAKVSDTLSQFLSSSALISTGYLGRITLGGVLSSFSAGSNLVTLIPNMLLSWKVVQRGMEVLDNTKRIAGVGLTERELFREFLLRRKNNLIPHTPGLRYSDVGSKLDSVNPLNFPDAVANIVHTFKHYGAMEGLSSVGDLAKNANYALYGAFGYVAAMLDLGFKWAAFRSVVDEGTLNSFGRLVNGGYRNITDIDQALRHVDEYFPAADEAGTWTRGVSRFIRPFFSYAMYAPPAALRHAIRRPSLFLNYERVQRLVNEEAANDDNANPVGGWWSDDLRNVPYSLWRTKDGLGWVTILTRNFDPFADGLQTWQDYADRTGELFGLFTGSSADQREKALDTTPPLIRFIQKEAETANPLIQSIVGMMTGKDPRTGRDFWPDSTADQRPFLGMKFDPLTDKVLRLYKPFADLDRFNPGDVFGTAEKRNDNYTPENDYKGDVTTEGKPSVFGVGRGGDIQKGDEADINWMTQAARALGARVVEVGVERGMQRTHNDNYFAAQELKKRLNEGTKRFNTDTNMSPQDKAALKAELLPLVDYLIQIEADNARVEHWMLKNKVPSTHVLKKLQERGLDPSQLEYPTAEYAGKLILDMAEVRRKIEAGEPVNLP
jgi:hypothetical protein